MKRISLLCATFVAAIFIPSITGAQAATECQAEIIKGRAAHWSWRLIDGRKCWYEGKHNPDKSELYWADKKSPASAVENVPEPRAMPRATDAQASPPPAAEEFTDPEDGSCCWPPKGSTKSSIRNEYQSEPPRDDETFEARWRNLGLPPRN